ncbi:ribonuclease HII [Novosphingobium sp. Fuku2-ISO-50]|uniref:ribonuclease HII n=1 Tax=Novosphingobium sp. Fuku2-ISO-50 TaxID=1739114 RepID=UPI00076D9B56|nr:ribonuclease HII [Novosphingobium sp. Fuku2-ISO-50]KUR77926.1 ribonuclease HII [Novosphingobium sp. Fuku2-ISO-50]
MSCPSILPISGLLIGVDEAGRGPLAGPVVAAAVVLGPDAPDGLADSKVLSARRRARLDPAIRATCLWGIGVVEADEIDRINIFAATMKAMTLAVSALVGKRDDVAMVLIDGNKTPAGRVPEWIWPARAIVGGDATEPAISAASILAKQHRDAIMHAAALEWPHYGWDRNAGYGTRQHLDALRLHGPCPLHRRSFGPVAQLTLI